MNLCLRPTRRRTATFFFPGERTQGSHVGEQYDRGNQAAGTINRNLAMVCNEFGMGMGLGSCRIIMDDDSYFEDFNMRDIIGEHLPLWANLGIAQVEELLTRKKISKASDLVKKLRADGLIVMRIPCRSGFNLKAISSYSPAGYHQTFAEPV